MGADAAQITALQAVLAKQQAALVAFMQKVEQLGKRVTEVELGAQAAKDGAIRFFGQVNVARLLGFTSIPAGGEVREDLAVVQARQGDWLPLSYPVVYVSRTDPSTSSTVSDAWLRTFSVDAATLQVQEYWVRSVAEDGKTPAFSQCTFRPV